VQRSSICQPDLENRSCGNRWHHYSVHWEVDDACSSPLCPFSAAFVVCIRKGCGVKYIVCRMAGCHHLDIEHQLAETRWSRNKDANPQDIFFFLHRLHALGDRLTSSLISVAQQGLLRVRGRSSLRTHLCTQSRSSSCTSRRERCCTPISVSNSIAIAIVKI
jgi:hypothetical protein